MGTGTGTLGGPNFYQLSITNAATLAAVPANPARIGLSIQNNSGNVITFTFGTTTPISQATGIQIAANGSATIPASGLGIVGNIGAQVNMIGSAAGPSNVSVLEYF
jgi:hypothetical protein